MYSVTSGSRKKTGSTPLVWRKRSVRVRKLRGKDGRQFLEAYPPREDGINRQALLEGRCVKIDDPAESLRANRKIGAPEHLWKNYPDKYPQGEGVRALACLPLVTGGKYEGVFYVHFWRDHKFTDDEIAWLELFADQASLRARRPRFSTNSVTVRRR